MRRIDTGVFILYPALVFAGIRFLGVRTTALLLFLLMGRRLFLMLFSDRRVSLFLMIQAGLIAAIQGAAAATGSALALRGSPFIVSLTFVAHFALSLRTIPLAEVFARLVNPNLPEERIAYCRSLTKVWIGVLCLNSAVLLVAMFVESDATWAVLVGPVSYSILGVTFAAEYVYRKWRFQDFRKSSAVDRLLEALLSRRYRLPR